MTADDLHFVVGVSGTAEPSIFGDHLVAGAVVADVRAERDVHIQRQRPHGPFGIAQGIWQVELARSDTAVG